MAPLVTFLIVVVLTSAATAHAFRRIGLRSEGIVAGLLIGVLLGPTVLGRLAPETWERTVVGPEAVEARERLEAARSERQAFSTAIGAAGLPRETVVAGLQERDTAIAANEIEVAEATLRHARPWSIATMLLAVAALWLGWSGTRRPDPTEEAPARSGVFALACWIVLLPGCLTLVLLRLTTGAAIDSSMVLVAIATAATAWPVAGPEARVLRRLHVSRLVTIAALLGTVLLIAPALAARSMGSPAWSVLALPLLCLGAAGPAVLGFGTARPKGRASIRGRRRIRALLGGVVLPGLAALCVIRSEVLLQTPWIVAIGLILVAGDGRAIAWMLGLRFAGVPDAGEASTEEQQAPTVYPQSIGWKAGLLASGAGGAQLAFTGAATALGGIGPGITVALVLAAAGVDLFGPVRRRMAGTA